MVLANEDIEWAEERAVTEIDLGQPARALSPALYTEERLSPSVFRV